ncbi:pyruvate dehydrogenase E2 component (dihydrolipoamide acetyltransferase) [Prauserella shujinwangii]|uniref:Dihydrolipoamide acetyltransferase component of pyruvate dehydrogenase complex n=1 Tax=Prauserella shujinwangii TaxID=1453103 RepID=A0A2T0LX22_9PSEU|nr:2-oxo acid dehydrogenase subunit E2 [Prauserella shujinwangii]PRX48509.1 pyruvate dehydrogenase E2 component (dihydrolipoamide acetyltransferase) [Prauserella shujinwangii]
MVSNRVPLVMPKMSMTMTEGVFLAWRKAEGDPVRQGEVVCEVTTDKVDMEVEATVDGVLAELVAAPEDVIAVGEPIAYVDSESAGLLDGLLDGPAPPAPAPSPEREPEQARAAPPEPAAAVPEPGRVAAVPAARLLAAERGIDLATVRPTGPWQTIRVSDVEGQRRGNGRGVVARLAEASVRIPQVVVYRDLDLETAAARRAGRPWTAEFLRAFAAALRGHPELNVAWTDGTVRGHERVGVALAVDTPRGPRTPVLTDPDLRSPDALAALVADVARRAHAGRLSLAELSAPAAATVSDLGALGVRAFQALLTPPQAAALAVGAVEPVVVPVPGGIGTRLRCTVGLTVDHRIADGAAAARLLGTVQRVLDAGTV